uniref:Protein kinase domain-containing protein n=1 Tax=Trichobilharzia regenti TaxID=157069 RepID=A0AA85KBS1_TRIRE|nr:unnamed protein product [Trichobilharzia regenti]
MFSRVQFRKTFKKAEDQDTDPFLLTKNVTLRKNADVRTYYTIGVYLGSGKFGEVKRCQEIKTGREFAAKFVPIASKEDMDSVMNEIAIMNTLRHPRLIQLYDAYHLDNEVTLVLELITGGELFERIIDESFDLNESRCIKFMHEILQGVEYMHSQNVIHLDLKPENILCLSGTSFKTKIIDFGLARFYENKHLCVLFGTPEFVSPEVISYEPVSPAADMWSLGVICYVMLSGLSPFMGESQGETLANIMRVKYHFDYPEFAEISNDARDFIKKLLVKDPRKRLTATECLQHQWLKQRKKTPKRSGTVSKKRLKHFVYRRKWQKAVNAIIALQRMGVVLQHSPVIMGKHSNQTLQTAKRSFESEAKRLHHPQVAELKLPSNSQPTSSGKDKSSPERVKKTSGIFRKTSFFNKAMKSDTSSVTTNTTTANSVVSNKSKLDKNSSHSSPLPKNKENSPLKIKHKESGKGFFFQRNKSNQRSISSDSSSNKPEISEQNSRSSVISESIGSTSKLRKDSSSSSANIKNQKKDNLTKTTSTATTTITTSQQNQKSTPKSAALPPPSISPKTSISLLSAKKSTISSTINEKVKSFNSSSTDGGGAIKAKSITPEKTITTTHNTTAGNLTGSSSKTTTSSTTPITTDKKFNFNQKTTSTRVKKLSASTTKSDIAAKISFFANLSKEEKVK